MFASKLVKIVPKSTENEFTVLILMLTGATVSVSDTEAPAIVRIMSFLAILPVISRMLTVTLKPEVAAAVAGTVMFIPSTVIPLASAKVLFAPSNVK